MTANELMIGDYVIRKNVPNEILIIVAIDSIKNIVYLDLDGLGITEKIENIEPIPLTSDILERNFTAIPNTFWSSVDYFYHNSSHIVKICRYIVDGTWEITYGKDTIGGKPEWNMYVTNVHELQHALRLCGIEKTIKLQHKKTSAMKYKLISKTFYDKKEYTVYKILCKKHWYLPWEGIGLDGSLHYYDELHEWYTSKEDAINTLKEVLKKIEVQKNYPIIKEEEIEL